MATEDNVEILLEVTGTMQWSARDQQELEKSQEKGQTAKLLTKPWLSIRSVPWLFCVNNKVIHHNDYAIEGSASPARRLRSQFVEKLDTLKTRYRYNTSKYSTLLGRKWPAVRRIVEGKPQLEVIKDATARVSYVEVHPCEPCQLGCAFCRGQLRMPAVPKKHEQKSDLDILGVIMRIREMNPLVFIRFSGTIGEPLLHKQIAESFRFLSKNHRHHWGVTTNGLLLGEMDYLETLMGAAYVHISLDAGSDKTYQRLKNGKPGHFDKVINNIQNLHSKKTERMPEIVVSFLLQDENYHEIRSLSNILKRIGTNTFEIKMQHYHPDRIMSAEKLRLAYQDIKRIQLEDSPTFQVIAVQSEFEAEKKIGLSPEAEQWSEASNPMSVEFARCYANELGLNATIDPRGRLQTCCQYYQDTLGIQAEDWRQLSPDFWTDSERAKTLAKKPHDVCKNCSPSDEVVNGFVKFLCDAQGADRRFLEWVENFFVEYEVGTADKKIPACS